MLGQSHTFKGFIKVTVLSFLVAFFAGPVLAEVTPPAQKKFAPQVSYLSMSFNIGQMDATLTKCQGFRSTYGTELDALVSEAHPNVRDDVMARYDSRYAFVTNQVSAAKPCPAGQTENLKRNLETYMTSLRPKVESDGAQSANAESKAGNSSSETVVASTSRTDDPICCNCTTCRSAWSRMYFSRKNNNHAWVRPDQCQGFGGTQAAESSCNVSRDQLICCEMPGRGGNKAYKYVGAEECNTSLGQVVKPADECRGKH